MGDNSITEFTSTKDTPMEEMLKETVYKMISSKFDFRDYIGTCAVILEFISICDSVINDYAINNVDCTALVNDINIYCKSAIVDNINCILPEMESTQYNNPTPDEDTAFGDDMMTRHKSTLLNAIDSFIVYFESVYGLVSQQGDSEKCMFNMKVFVFMTHIGVSFMTAKEFNNMFTYTVKPSRVKLEEYKNAWNRLTHETSLIMMHIEFITTVVPTVLNSRLADKRTKNTYALIDEMKSITSSIVEVTTLYILHVSNMIHKLSQLISKKEFPDLKTVITKLPDGDLNTQRKFMDKIRAFVTKVYGYDIMATCMSTYTRDISAMKLQLKSEDDTGEVIYAPSLVS